VLVTKLYNKVPPHLSRLSLLLGAVDFLGRLSLGVVPAAT
jgi:hypothetical protein